MWKNKSVWVVMPAYNEEEGVYNTVRGFYKIPEVDKVLVVDNNSSDKTAKLAKKAGAIVISERIQGYGYACMKALRSSKGYYTILTESDNSFVPEDINKFFSFSDNFDIIKGGRSNEDMIEEGADWTPFLKYGNWFLAKLTQVLYQGPSMREAGGTFRMINRPCLNFIIINMTEKGSAFLPDMTTIALRGRFKVLEIPVRYGARQGQSKITGDRWNALKLGFSMIRVIIWNRVKKLKGKPLSKN